MDKKEKEDDRILQIKLEGINKKMVERQYPQTLFHYTAMPSFYNIIKNHQIWFGNASTMNDKGECRYLIDSLYRVLNENLLEEPQKRCKSFFQDVYTELRDEYPYLISFSELKDDAGQWERYADNAQGVRIGFNTKNLWLVYSELDYIFGRVYYGGDVRKHELYSLLYDYFTTGYLRGFDKESEVIRNLIACGYYRKHESFKNEEEIRFAVLWNNIPNGACVESECINGQIKKYMKFDLNALCKRYNLKFEDIFEEIMIGPRSNQNVKDMVDFLSEYSLSALAKKVKKSECPLR